MKTFWRLLSFLKPVLGWVILSILLSTATIASGIGLLGTSASLIARAALQPSIATLQIAIVGVRFFGLSRGVFRYLERLSSHSVNFRLLAGLRGWFYRSIEQIPPLKLIGIESGDLLSRAIADIDTLENFYVRVVAPPITALLVIFGVGWLVGCIDLVSGLTLAAGLLVTGILIPFIAYFVNQKIGRIFVEARARTTSALIEMLQGISDLTAYGWGQIFIERIARFNRQLEHTQRRDGWVEGTVNSLSLLISQLTMAGVLWLAVPQVVGGNIPGYLLAVLAMVSLASFEAVTPLPLAAQQLESSLHSARRLFELADSQPEGKPIVQSRMKFKLTDFTHLEINGLSYRYAERGEEALSNVDFILNKGKKMAVVGVSGSGKSTLVNVLLRFIPDYQGVIKVNRHAYTELLESDCRLLYAVISQSTYLFNTSVRQNLLLANSNARDEELILVCERAGIGSWLAGLPAGLDTWIGEHGLHMSGGERQRLALARTLLVDAPILLLDEPTAHLDPLHENQILNELLSSNRDRSVLLITHRFTCLEQMDEILVLDRGQVVERGMHADLLVRKGLYWRMWNLQRNKLIT
jgi:ATP-binding cassette subfamily C protein CydC